MNATPSMYRYRCLKLPFLSAVTRTDGAPGQCAMGSPFCRDPLDTKSKHRRGARPQGEAPTSASAAVRSSRSGAGARVASLALILLGAGLIFTDLPRTDRYGRSLSMYRADPVGPYPCSRRSSRVNRYASVTGSRTGANAGGEPAVRAGVAAIQRATRRPGQPCREIEQIRVQFAVAVDVSEVGELDHDADHAAVGGRGDPVLTHPLDLVGDEPLRHVVQGEHLGDMPASPGR